MTNDFIKQVIEIDLFGALQQHFSQKVECSDKKLQGDTTAFNHRHLRHYFRIH